MSQLDNIDTHRKSIGADIDFEINNNKTLDPVLLRRAKTMLLSYGACNASKGTGIFNDEYLRCGSIIDPNGSLIYSVIKNLRTTTSKKNQYIIPISDESLITHLIHDINKFDDEIIVNTITMNIYSRKVPCMELILIRKEKGIEHDLSKILQIFGKWGALATKDTLLWISSIFTHKTHETIVLNPIQSKDKNINEVLDAIRVLCREKIKNRSKSATEHKAFNFYRSFEATLVNKIQQCISENSRVLSTVENNLIYDSLNRFLDKIHKLANENLDYFKSLVLLELAFDEIINVLHIAKFYNKESIFKSINSYIIDNFNLFEHEKPAQTMLGSSCMQVLNNNIFAALRYFSDTEGDIVNICVGKEVYHEVPDVLGIAPDSEVDKNLCYDNMRLVKIADHETQLAHIMVMAFHANVHRLHSGFLSNNVLLQIDAQLILRKKLKSKAQLIAIIDLTLTDLQNDQIQLLLCMLKTPIVDGKLAVIFTYSLNKYFHIGFDRTPAGISAAFFNKESYNNFKPNNEIIGFDEFDATPQIITHLLKYGAASLRWYYNHVHKSTKYIHNEVIPSELFDTKKPIHFGCPFTNDGYKTTWSFVIVHFSDKNTANNYLKLIEEHMRSINILWRDGFAFNHSTYLVFQEASPPFIRISVGPDATKKQFLSLVSFLSKLNEEITNLPEPSKKTNNSNIRCDFM